MLYYSLPMVVLSLLGESFVGAVVGFLAAALIYRSRVTRRFATLPMVIGAVLFVVLSGVVGWAGLHSFIENGRMLDFTPSGEDLRLRNWIVQHQVLILFGPSFTGALIYAALRKKPTRRQ